MWEDKVITELSNTEWVILYGFLLVAALFIFWLMAQNMRITAKRDKNEKI
jgi:hypothetical protein